MKINSGVNIQSNNYNKVRSHIERKFEDKDLSERNWDSNLGINWKLSQFNKGTDGRIIYDKSNHKHPYTFKFNKRGYNHIERLKLKMIKNHASPYIERINASKSVKINPSRKITKLSQVYNPKSERTTVDSFSSGAETGLQTNYDNIKLIQKHYGKGYKNAYIRYIKAVSLGLERYEQGFNSRYKYVKKFHHFSNVDETTGDTKPSKRPDALHDHSEILGFAWSKYDQDGNPITQKYQTTDKKGKVHNHRAGKPSFDVDRALCHEFNIKYSKKNAGRAVSIFRKREAKEIVKNVQSVLEQRFSKVPEFHTMTYTPTKSQQTGLSQAAKKRLLKYKDKARQDVADRNRNRARRLMRETRKLEYKKAHRKRNRARARRAIKRKNRAKRRYAEYQRANESLKATKEKYAHSVNSYSKQAFSMSNEVSALNSLKQHNNDTWKSQVSSMANLGYSMAQPRIKHAINSGKSSVSVSAAASASASFKDKDDSFNKKSASFDSSAYGSYATVLSSGLTQYLPKAGRSNYDWLALAKGSTVTIKSKTVSHPLVFYASYQVSTANKASKAYNHIQKSNKSLNDENTSLKNENKDLKDQNGKLSGKILGKTDNFNQDIKQNLINLGMTSTSAEHYYQANKMKITRKKPLIQILMDKVHSVAHSVIHKAKIKAQRIINDAKYKAKMWTGIGDNGLNAMQDYIYNNNPRAAHIPDREIKERQAQGQFDPANLYGKDFLKAYNDTADYVHSQKVRQWQRQHGGYQPPEA